MPSRLPPAYLLIAALVLALATAGAMVLFAADQSWLGLRMAYDAKAGGARVVASQGPAAQIPPGTVVTMIAGAGDSLRLEAQDLTVEPDGAFPRYADYHVFLDRLERLHRMQASPAITFTDAAGRAFVVRPGPSRPLHTLPPEFWVQAVTGALSFLIAAAIWAFRRGDTAARYLLLSGAAIMISAATAAPYTTRELAMPLIPFRWLDDLNFLGGSLFAASLAALLLYYPKRLAPRWVGWVVVGVFVAWFAAQELGAFDSMSMARRLLVMIALLATFALAAVHWWLTRRDPIARAALQWFLLSWVAVVGLFGFIILLPQMFGVDTSGLQSYGFGVFILVYVGLAFGILRFRLFELGEWWGRVMGWLAGLIVLVVFDLVFLMGLKLSSTLSLSLALLVCGLIWLPARTWLWSRFFRRGADDERARFERVVEVAFTRDPEEQAERWRGLMQKAFDPLRIETAAEAPRAGLNDNGLALTLPAVDRLPALRLEYAQGGRRLFTRTDLARARELDGMLRYVLQSRGAYEDGVSVERRRIASDIHDNLGAPLVRALHVQDGARKDELIRETLSDLRGIINDAARPAGGLAATLADIRLETARRAEDAGLAFDWILDDDETAADLASGAAHALRSILREAASNVLKHARANRLRVTIERRPGRLRLSVEDDGRGFDPVAIAAGEGLASISARAAALGGTAVWSKGEAGAGARLVVEAPLA